VSGEYTWQMQQRMTTPDQGFLLDGLCQPNHKDIGILYLFTAGLLGFVSVSFTIYMRLELMEPGVQYMCMEKLR
jgi:cytochrome c oxidase subunit 1